MTAVSTTGIQNSSLDTDAEWRAFGSKFSDLFAAAGLTKTSATGQTDWTTITTATSSTSEQWQFTDARAGSEPILMKVLYQISSGNGLVTLYFGRSPTTGTASSSFGIFYGATSNQVLSAASVAASDYFAYAAHGAGYFSLSVGRAYDVSKDDFFIVVGRTSRTNGAVVVRTAACNSGSTAGVADVYIRDGDAAQITGVSHSLHPVGYYGSVAPDVEVFPLYVKAASSIAPELFPFFATMVRGEITPYFQTFTVTVGGTSRTYLALPSYSRQVDLSCAVIHE